MIVVGVDENGLGPRLGPLVGTATAIEVSAYDARSVAAQMRAVGITDSKASAGYGKMALAESIALAVCVSLRGAQPETADELLDVLSIDALATLRKPCPARSRAQCWAHDVALPAFGGDVGRGRVALDALCRQGTRVLAAKSAIACVQKINREQSAGRSRVALDLLQFERLLLDVRAVRAEPMIAVCGMVGGIRDYRSRFEILPREDLELIEQRKGVCSYRVAGLGVVSFEVDADASHGPVALASMIGKYVRELWMERQNRFYKGHVSELVPASGYHDPVTERFVQHTARVRKKLRVVDECFERQRSDAQG